MSEWRRDEPATGNYPGPPPTTPYAQPGPYAQPVPNAQSAPYPQAGPPPNPWMQPGYPPGYPGQLGPYPPAYNAYGFATVPPGEARPGTTTTAAILGYVLGGLLIIAGIVLFVWASADNALQDALNNGSNYSAELVFAGFVNLVAAGLLIAGSVMMTARNPRGRLLYAIGAGIELVAAVYWIARWATKDELQYLLVWALLFSALSVVGLSMAFTGGAGRWLARR